MHQVSHLTAPLSALRRSECECPGLGHRRLQQHGGAEFQSHSQGDRRFSKMGDGMWTSQRFLFVVNIIYIYDLYIWLILMQKVQYFDESWIQLSSSLFSHFYKIYMMFGLPRKSMGVGWRFHQQNGIWFIYRKLWKMAIYSGFSHLSHLGKFDQDQSLFSWTLESWLILGKSSPFMAARFRLVKYYNLPRFMDINPKKLTGEDTLGRTDVGDLKDGDLI